MQLIRNIEEYSARTFVRGDEIALTNLFNAANRNFAGYVPRTPEYWVWCCLNRPDVNEKSVVIVNKGNKVVGYAVVGKSGDIWELCYDSLYDGKAIVSMLLSWALDYARSVGSDSVTLNAFEKDDVIRTACRELDFDETPPETVYFSILDLPNLICEIFRTRGTKQNINGTFWFKLNNCPSWCDDSFGVKLKKDEASLFEEVADCPEVVIEADMTTLVACIFGTESILRAILASKVRFRPFWKALKFMKFFSVLRIRSPWVLPRADIG